MISEGCYLQIFSIIITFVLRVFVLSESINKTCYFELVLAIKVTRTIKLVREINVVCDHLSTPRNSNKPRTSWALQAFKPVCKTTFETTFVKLQNFFSMELVTDVTLLFLGNKLYLEWIWGNIACYGKYQCKEKYISFFGHQNLAAHSGILVWKFHWIIHCLDNNRPIA